MLYQMNLVHDPLPRPLSFFLSFHFNITPIYAYECAYIRRQILLPSKGSRPGRNLLVCGVDHSPSSNAEVKNEWSYTSALSVTVCLHDVYRNNFTFTFT